MVETIGMIAPPEGNILDIHGRTIGDAGIISSKSSNGKRKLFNPPHITLASFDNVGPVS
jgi:hypothetical protein